MIRTGIFVSICMIIALIVYNRVEIGIFATWLGILFSAGAAFLAGLVLGAVMSWWDFRERYLPNNRHMADRQPYFKELEPHDLN